MEAIHMKIGITGATGKLGHKVIEQLKLRTDAKNLVTLVRTPQKAADLELETRRFDYMDDVDTLSATLSDIDKLLLISGNEAGKRLKQHTHVVKAAQKAGVKLLVYTSLLHANTSTLSLAAEHLATENIIKASGLKFVILRNSWYTENYTDSLPSVISSGVLLGCSGEGKISSATREDYATAAAVVLTTNGHDNKTYELAGDEAFTMTDFAKELSIQTGKNIPYKNLSAENYRTALIQTGLPERAAIFYAGSHISTERGDLFDDGHQLSKLIQRPTTPLSKAIEQKLSELK